MKSFKHQLLNYDFSLTLLKAGIFTGDVEIYFMEQKYCTKTIIKNKLYKYTVKKKYFFAFLAVRQKYIVVFDCVRM
jgi:hypothetical protein